MERIAPKYTMPDLWLDDDHFIEFILIRGETEPCGGVFWHRRAESASGWCCGAFYWRYPSEPTIGNHGHIPAHGETWQLESRDPLTLSPSFLCHCGCHGYVKQGKWIRV